MKKLLLAGIALIVTGCMKYTSVTTIKEDGSGFLSILFEIPQTEDVNIGMIEFEVADSVPGWKTTLMTSDTLDNSIVYRIEGTFENPRVLVSVFDVDNVVFEEEEAGEVIRYHLHMPPVYLPGTHVEATFESARTLIRTGIKYGSDDYILTEKLVLPGKIIEHNANMRTKDTLVWNVDAMELLKEEIVVDAVWEVPR